MNFEELQEYRDIIYAKLKNLEKKFKLSYTTQKNKEELIELGKNLYEVRQALVKLERNKITWNDLNILGINKISLEKIEEMNRQRHQKEEFQKNSLMESIPMIILVDNSKSIINTNHLNKMYSIIEYINKHYQTLFTQKSLLSSAKTSPIREKFYIQYQEISHIFKSYAHLVSINSKSSYDLERLSHKEFVILLKKIYTFLLGIKEYIEMVQKDATFNSEDFREPIKSLDSESSISGLSLEVALKECHNFVSQSLEYIHSTNRDIFDALNIEESKKDY